MRVRTVLALFLLILLAPAVSRAQGAPTGNVGWYNGDCQSGIPGQANWYTAAQQFSRTYDNFLVPGAGWVVTGVFSVNSMSVDGVTAAVWEIRSGVSTGNGGVIVASGMSAATQTLLATWPDGERIYRIQVDGLRARLPAGTYWLNVSPVVPYAYNTQSYVCATRGAAAAGTPAGNDGSAYFYSLAIPGNTFQDVQNVGTVGVSGDFSQGVLISSSSTPSAAPVIAAVVNAASWRSGPVSPGELVTLQGTALGPATAATMVLNPNGRVATSLDAVQVFFGGIAAPQIYVSGAQINAIVPYEISGVSNPAVQVIVDGQPSNSFPVTVSPAAPALFTANGSGSGPGAILNQDYSYNGIAHPAPKGSYVVLYLTGEGPTNPAGVTGKITTVAKSDPLTPQPVSPVSVLIGGLSAPVLFYGEAPGMVSGVMQLNIQIPAAAPSGSLPVSVSVAGIPTPTGVTIAVQ